jgi:hypothetical protein
LGLGHGRRAALHSGIKMAAEELGIFGGIGEGHCCGDEWVSGKGLSAGKLPGRHASGAIDSCIRNVLAPSLRDSVAGSWNLVSPH